MESKESDQGVKPVKVRVIKVAKKAGSSGAEGAASSEAVASSARVAGEASAGAALAGVAPVVDEVAIMGRIAEELKIRTGQVSAVVSLTAEGCTIPFISRYRKERTGSLDEVQVRDCVHKFESYKNLEERRVEVIKGIDALGKLDESLLRNIRKANTMTELEDLWAPFKKKKKTRGMLAMEKGLEPLSALIVAKPRGEVDAAAPGFVGENPEHPELTVKDAQDAIAGAKDIVAERLSQDVELRAIVKSYFYKTGKIATKGVGDDEKREKSTYQMYWEYSEPISSLKSHRVLAINRGEREGELTVAIDVDEEGAIGLLKDKVYIHNDYHAEAVEDGLIRLLSPAVVRELRSDSNEYAETHAIDVFSENLKNLLMQPPLRGSRVLGIDPGIRTGTKCAALDETGKFLEYFVINQETKREQAVKAIIDAVKRNKVEIIAVGNGTATQEVQAVVADAISEAGLECKFTAVDEDGASVYSASDLAREEFPELDLTIRGAISIGRRLQDPLAELVKIDPKSIGVGLYQHDVNQKQLSDRLDEVVGSVVNKVGVNLNTASHAILRYVSGINAGLAKKIVKYRDEKGAIKARSALMEIPGMGEKTYEQCAGFLKIPESANELDNTWVHPENYALAAEILPIVKSGKDPDRDARSSLKARYTVGDTTMDDIIAELKKPNRDPRSDLPPPILQKGAIKFEDLKEGMKVQGKIKNVVDFGAFVDIGIKESALIHVSEMADRFVRDPLDELKVGDMREFTIISLDASRRRIGLSLKSRPGEKAVSRSASKQEAGGDRGATGAVKKPSDLPAQKKPARTSLPSRPSREDDGTTYNPFAALLKKRK